jgi:hypothetical protein
LWPAGVFLNEIQECHKVHLWRDCRGMGSSTER